MNKLVIFILIIFSSCSITKRKYQKGYYINWSVNYSCKSNESKQLNESQINFSSTDQDFPIVFETSLCLIENNDTLKLEIQNKEVISKSIHVANKSHNISKSYFKNKKNALVKMESHLFQFPSNFIGNKNNVQIYKKPSSGDIALAVLFFMVFLAPLFFFAANFWYEIAISELLWLGGLLFLILSVNSIWLLIGLILLWNFISSLLFLLILNP